VHEKVYDQYLEEFVKEVKSWKVGSHQLKAVFILDPLTRKQQLDLVEQQVTEAKEKGAVILNWR
jgi:acyl-CoA reductase-like NAD-dependent aldehyde dehydrogenase